MAEKTSQESFKNLLDSSGHRVGVVLPAFVAIGTAILQYVSSDYFSHTSRLAALAVTVVFALIALAEIFNKRPSKAWRTVQYIITHGLVFYSLSYMLPLPSPYLLYVVMMSFLVYFDFGFPLTLVSMFGLFFAFTGRYIQVHGFGQNSGLDYFIAFYAAILVITYYSILFLQIAQKELKSVRASSKRASNTQKRIESLINNISDGVIAVDEKLKINVYNASALNVLDLNTDIRDHSLTSILKPVNEEGHAVSIAKLLKDAESPTINRDLRIKYKDGSTANLFLGISPIYLGYGKKVNNGYTLLLRDITREKSLEEERDEFISVVSHELRTPIAISEGNIGNAEYIVEKTGDMEAVKKALKEAHHQVLFLADMINDLATLSRAERGVLQVDVEPINAHELVNELGNNYTPQAEAKGLKLVLDIDPKLEMLYTSKLYSREILQNFITNAIKYTEKGTVTLKAKPTDKGVQFAVQDTGIGISKSDQDRVYDKFFRSEDYRTRQNNGTGLGLYVTMKLAGLIHADISLQSELNKGSTFSIFIPNLEMEAPRPVAEPPKSNG
ncbi:MAG: domain S-box protein [Candidatus Saccharibacteria bacterium]|nr:domain S-box protein [Candidatus Saccharibacteria bacterium]